MIKDPAELSDNKDYESQICHFLDRHKKCHLFDNSVTLLLAGFHDIDSGLENKSLEDDDEAAEPEDSNPHPMAVLTDLWGPVRQAMNFFDKAEKDAMAGASKVWPPHSFIAGSSVIHLNYDPSCNHISIDEALKCFSLPDLRGALVHYFIQEEWFSSNLHTIRQHRCATVDASLLFDDLQLWHKVHIQQKSYHDASVICPTFTVNASLPNGPWKYGHYNVAIFAINEAQHWPISGLAGVQYLFSSDSIYDIDDQGILSSKFE